jgi:8-hydroxy-5-deazaflavin:NADPH oxidoreductase
VLGVYYPDAREAVKQYRDQLAGKTLVDITNPVNDSVDALVVPPDGSASKELSQLAPAARFVKAFNTTFASASSGARGARPPAHDVAGRAGHGLRQHREDPRLKA